MNENLQDLIKMLTGFSNLDLYLTGLRKGDLITIASRPKNGRTTLAIDIGTFVAGVGITVAIFNLKNEVIKTNKKLKNMYIFNDFNLDRIKEKSIKLLLDKNLSLVIIDDIELIQNYNNTVWLELYKMAKELDIPIIVTARIDIIERKDNKPYLADLSNSILCYSKQILLMYRNDLYNKDKKTNIVEVTIAKNANGPTGVIKLESMEK